MSSFVLKTFFFFLVTVALLQLPSNFLPEYWGNEIYDSKFYYLDNSNMKFDTYFVGTSRVANGINPKLFNRLNHGRVSSFNLACPGSNGFENLKIIKSLIEKDNYGAKTIFLEAPLFIVYKGKNRETVRGRYFFDYASYIWIIKNIIYNQNYCALMKVKGFLDYTKLYLSNLLKFKLLSGQVYRIYFGVSQNMQKILDRNKGFFPLSVNTIVKENQKRRVLFLKDTSILKKREKGAIKVFSKKREDSPNIDRQYFEILNALIKNADKKGIKLFYFFLPKAPESYYKSSYGGLMKLPKDRFINLADSREYPEFYELKYSFDRAHLNMKGANKLTTELAEIFKATENRSK